MTKIKTSILQYKLVKATVEPNQFNTNKHSYFIAINENEPKQSTSFLLSDNILQSLKSLGLKGNKKNNVFILLGKNLYCYLLIKDCLKNKVKQLDDFLLDRYNFNLYFKKEKEVKKLTKLILKKRLTYNEILIALLFGTKESNSLYIIPAYSKNVWTSEDLNLLDFKLLEGFELKKQLISFNEKKLKQSIN